MVAKVFPLPIRRRPLGHENERSELIPRASPGRRVHFSVAFGVAAIYPTKPLDTQGAGKSRVARLLAGRFERGACIDADDLLPLVVVWRGSPRTST